MYKTNSNIKAKIKFQVFYGTFFNQVRYYIYRLTDISSNKKGINFCFIFSILYNLFFSLIPLIIIFPIIINYIFVPNQDDINQYIQFNNMMSKFMYIEYIGCHLLLINFFIGLFVADYKFPIVYRRWNAVLKYCCSFVNFYKFASCISLIIIFHEYGKFDSTNWYINFNVLGSNFVANNDYNINQYYSWNPGQLVFVSLFIFNIISIIPNFIFAFKNKKYFQAKYSILHELKKNWKTPVFATIFLILIIFIFSFIILKTETSYYSDWISQHPNEQIQNAPNYSYSPKNFWDSIWYCLITITTVGYGQIIPQAPASRIVAVFLIIIGVSYYSFYSVFFVSIYTKIISAKKDNNDINVKNLKNEIINELLKYKVIDEKVYQENLEKNQNKIKHNINNNFLKLLNNNINKVNNINNKFEYQVIDNNLGNCKSHILMINVDNDQIEKLKPTNKYFTISYNPFFIIAKIDKIIVYDNNSKSAILEFTIDNPILKKNDRKLFIKYHINNFGYYSDQFQLNLIDFNINDYKYLINENF